MEVNLLIAVLSALFSFVGSYAATRTHLQYLRRDCDRAHDRLDQHERWHERHERGALHGNQT